MIHSARRDRPRPPPWAPFLCYTGSVGKLLQKERMTNVTVAIDGRLLLAVCKLALEQGTSVNQLVRDHLEELVERRGRRRAARQRLGRAMGEKATLVGERTWTRDDLHER